MRATAARRWASVCAASSSLSGAGSDVGELAGLAERDELAGAVLEVAAVAAPQLVERVVVQRAPQIAAPAPSTGRQARVGGEDRERVGDEVFGVFDAERVRELAREPRDEPVAFCGEALELGGGGVHGHLHY